MELCRCCNGMLPDKTFLKFENMPKSAQLFPGENGVTTEKGVAIILKQCPWCGLVQTTGEPVPYYRDVIRATGVSKEMMEFRESQYAAWVKENHLENGKILEVGCGKGEYMTMMESTGCTVVGLEHLAESVDKAAEYGHEVIKGFIENANTLIDGAPYDGFYIMNFLEHIPKPNGFLKGICNNLNDNAVGLVEVPNFDMMIRNAMYSEFIQDHLSYFTIDTLSNLLRLNGFEVLSCGSIWYDYIISACVRKRAGLAPGLFIDKQNELKNKVLKYLKRQKTAGKRIATWGAGHQALANLSLLGMAPYIEYVIDSASFKQGKYTPATHISICSPQKLKESPVDSVIIMAGGYSQEIKKILTNEFPNVEIAILGNELVAEGE